MPPMPPMPWVMRIARSLIEYAQIGLVGQQPSDGIGSGNLLMSVDHWHGDWLACARRLWALASHILDIGGAT